MRETPENQDLTGKLFVKLICLPRTSNDSRIATYDWVVGFQQKQRKTQSSEKGLHVSVYIYMNILYACTYIYVYMILFRQEQSTPEAALRGWIPRQRLLRHAPPPDGMHGVIQPSCQAEKLEIVFS